MSCFPLQLAEDAGFPAGVINTIPCSRDHVDQVTDALLGNDLVAKMSFTGSTATGKVARQLEWNSNFLNHLRDRIDSRNRTQREQSNIWFKYLNVVKNSTIEKSEFHDTTTQLWVLFVGMLA